MVWCAQCAAAVQRGAQRRGGGAPAAEHHGRQQGARGYVAQLQEEQDLPQGYTSIALPYLLCELRLTLTSKHVF